jgi:SAM-dependent methyltransferase
MRSSTHCALHRIIYFIKRGGKRVPDLARLLAETVVIQPDWCVLIAAWNSSTLASALGQTPVLVRLSGCPMTDAFASSQDDVFDMVVCEEAARHVRDVAGLVHECRRTLRPGGYLVLWDQAIAGPPRAARYINLLESFRDPTHEWAYSLEDWETFLLAEGLEWQLSRTSTARLAVDDWAEGYLSERDDLLRAHVLVRRAPAEAAQALGTHSVGLTTTFERTFALVAARKPPL